jgi:ribonuclease HII
MFKPKGEEAVWKMIYDHVVNLPIGEIITFNDIQELIDDDFEKNRSSVYRANKELMKTNKRILVSARGVGYKVVEGANQLMHAEDRHDRANRQIKMANFEALNINTKVMSIDERQRWSQFLAWNGTVLSALSHNAQQVAKANVVAKVATDTVMQELDKLRQQIDSYTTQVSDMQEKVSE